jgi:hypothetical protein
MQSAQAQNLVQDPNFTLGLTDFTSSGGATPDSTSFPGVTGVDISTYNYIEQGPLVGYQSGVTYVFTFLAALTAGSSTSSLYAGFGPTCSGDCSSASITPTISSNSLTQFSFSATSTSASNSYLELYSYGPGTVFVTDLSIQPEGAPAPVAGGGLASICVAMAGLAFRRRGRNQRMQTV